LGGSSPFISTAQCRLFFVCAVFLGFLARSHFFFPSSSWLNPFLSPRFPSLLTERCFPRVPMGLVVDHLNRLSPRFGATPLFLSGTPPPSQSLPRFECFFFSFAFLGVPLAAPHSFPVVPHPPSLRRVWRLVAFYRCRPSLPNSPLSPFACPFCLPCVVLTTQELTFPRVADGQT